MDILIRILSFVNILTNSFEVDGRTLGRNAIGGSYSHYRAIAPQLPDLKRAM